MRKNRTDPRRDYLILIAAGMLFFLPFLGGIQLFDWDEINFAECSREMILSGDYLRVQIDFEPFWEKPPLFFWLQAATMKVFGIGEYAARFPNAICGILTLCFLYYAGSKWHSRTFGWLWALAYFGSTLPHLYFKSGIIDPWFNLFTFGALFFFIEDIEEKKGDSWDARGLAAGLLLGLAVLTKGPAAPLMALLTLLAFRIRHARNFRLPWRQLGLISLGAALPAFVWFGLETLKNGPWFVEEFIRYQYRLFSTPDAGHQGFPGFHPVVLLLGCFPASIFAIPSFSRKLKLDGLPEGIKSWMILLFWVVVILFSIVQSKIIHYSSLAYFPLTFLAAHYLTSRLESQKAVHKGVRYGLIAVSSLYILANIALPVLGANPDWIHLKDEFANAQLQAGVNWHPLEGAIALVPAAGLFLFFYFHKKNQLRKAVHLIFLAQVLYITLALFFFAGKIQQHSQGATIAFYQDRAGEDCYILPLYKTYGHLFYAEKTPAQKLPEDVKRNWLFTGDIDKDVYFIRRVHQALWMEEQPPDIQEIQRENGFVFYKRTKVESRK
jgi:4-amino-4-deoxy-L-arabinose transferase-like glycosyltransferase